MMEMQLIAAMMVQAFDLHLVPGAEVLASPGLVLSPRGGRWMTVHPRA
jgi:cytochrome P450